MIREEDNSSAGDAFDSKPDGFDLFAEYAKGYRDGVFALAEILSFPSCSTCRFGMWDEDRSVGIPLHLEDCKVGFGDANQEEVEQLFDTGEPEETLAELCNRWQPDLHRVSNLW